MAKIEIEVSWITFDRNVIPECISAKDEHGQEVQIIFKGSSGLFKYRSKLDGDTDWVDAEISMTFSEAWNGLAVNLGIIEEF